METIKTQAVTFDVGRTLIEPWPSVGEVYAQVAQEHGFEIANAQQIEAQFQQAWADKADFRYTEEGWLGLVIKSFAGILSQDQCAQIFPRLYQRFEQADVWRIHDDVLPTLDDLAGRGFRLAVVSNWDTRLRTLLNELKLMSFFETASISSEVGFTKPSPVLFEHVLKKLGLSGSAVVHVGDSTREDIDGAEGAGITGVLVRRSEGNSIGAISKLTELITLLSEAW
ncbi:MAG: Phosphoglycolate phosphatase [Verrucomicrobia subdivision 3 bacterium]|nr:Phosphoglycolate phosphatase [Limisphaerales bacterium]MCS1413138.1 Phosphoglycolate phosphatase [Limisphaerales bacterium]